MIKLRHAFVTGAANGIGAATARHLSSRGWAISICDTDLESGQRLSHDLGANARFIPLDVTSYEGWVDCASALEVESTQIDLLFLNAGVMSRPRGAPVLDDPAPWFSAESFQRVRSVNIDGVVLGILAMLPILESSAHPNIIINASEAAFMQYPRDPLYAMSKAAVVSLARSLGPMLEPSGIAVNVICPYSIATDLTPSDLRGVRGRSLHAEQLAAGLELILESGRTGDVWVMRQADQPPEVVLVIEPQSAAEVTP